MHGTEWVAPGAGSTVRDLVEAGERYIGDESGHEYFEALRDDRVFVGQCFDKRSALLLTGKRLSGYSIQRIRAAIDRVAGGETGESEEAD